MKTQTTKPTQEENNRLIAEFMGEKYSIGLMGHPLINHKTIGYTPIRYHDSWDWLMPVVEKIRSENHRITGDTDRLGNLYRSLMMVDIECAYKYSVEAIGWLKLRQKGGAQDGD